MSISRAIVLGLGSSGEAASFLLAAGGAKVRVFDNANNSVVLGRAEALRARGVSVSLGAVNLSADDFQINGSRADVCVVSPGVPCQSPWLQLADRLGIEVLAEIDIGFRAAGCPIIAVTGSNGKSTLVKLLHETIQLLGMRSAACGNYGDPISKVAAEKNGWDRLVAEISTFQMERSEVFAPQTAVLLNIQPNHLDRHGSMDIYVGLKAKMFAKMPSNGIAITNQDAVDAVANCNKDLRLVTIGNRNGVDFHYQPGKVSGKGAAIDVAGTFVDNPIMGLTASAALAVVVENGWAPEALEQTIKHFIPLDFRMQTIGQLNGVRFVNNSKATTLAALGASLQMVDGPIRLVSGGRLKEKDLDWIKNMLVKHVASAYLYGQVGDELAAAWGDAVTCGVFENLHQATQRALSDAESGDVVLLSPGCASFDQYSGYAERGRDFNRVVEEFRRESV